MTFFVMRIEAILHHYHNLERLAPAQSQHLFDRLEALTPSVATGNVYPCIDVMILDGAVVVNFLKPANCKTFADYAHVVFIKYVFIKVSTL